MTKILYLMRHGQTLFNQQHKIQGWCDSPLTSLGMKQARIASQYFKDHQIHWDHAYASTSERACDTLEIVTEHQMPYRRLKELKERNFGAYEGKDECLTPKTIPDDFFVYCGGETKAETQKRVNEALIDIMNQEDHQIVLAVSHGGTCALFYEQWKEYARVEKPQRLFNCCIFKYEYDQDIFTLKEIINEEINE